MKLNLFSNIVPTKGSGFSTSFDALIIPKIKRTKISKLAVDKIKPKDGTAIATIFTMIPYMKPKTIKPKDCFK